MRTWEECKKEWEMELERMRSSDNEGDKKNLLLIEAGMEPTHFPPIGIRLSLQEYQLFDLQARNFKEIHGWTPFGKDIHECVRENFRLPNLEDPKRMGNKFGVKTPRKGYYWVLEILGDKNKTLMCKYNAFDDKIFWGESVEISAIPLYTPNSIGPNKRIKEGDIICIKENPTLVPVINGGSRKGAYKIEWNICGYKCTEVEHSNGDSFEIAEKETWDVKTGGMCGDFPGEQEEDMYYDSLGH